MITKEGLMGLPYDEGKVWAIADTPGGKLLAVGTLETPEGDAVLVAIAYSNSVPVPLDSFAKFQVPITFLDEPEPWDGGDRGGARDNNTK